MLALETTQKFMNEYTSSHIKIQKNSLVLWKPKWVICYWVGPLLKGDVHCPFGQRPLYWLHPSPRDYNFTFWVGQWPLVFGNIGNTIIYKNNCGGNGGWTLSLFLRKNLWNYYRLRKWLCYFFLKMVDFSEEI